MDTKIIELSGLTKNYGSFTAVDHLTLSVRKGEIYGLLGPNGAGKSTTILMILGLTDPTSGNVTVCGINSTKNPIEVKKRVGYLPEDIGFYDDYSGFENLVYTARLNSIPLKIARQRAEELLSKVGLSCEANKSAGKYSRGMRQRLGLADVLIKNPEVIILDEPTLGIDPKGIQELLGLILKLSREEGLTILLSSHHLQQVQQICDRVGLFVAGRLVTEGDINSLSKQMFSDEPFTLETGIRLPDNISIESLAGLVKEVDGVLKVEPQEGFLRIGCTRDLTQEIVSAIVKSGTGLTFLNKKVYGLNDIYNRYFEEA
jgi:ABC-2 type transport system ATP-binding protein